MASINYDSVFSRFYTKIEAFDLIDESMTDAMVEEFMHAWLRSAIAYPYIRRLFKTLSVDDENGVFDYTLRYSIDEFSDEEFVTEILAYGMVYSWLEPKVKSITNIYQMFGGSEQRWFSESKHLSELRALASDTESRIRSLIRDRGYLNNTWLDGE